MGNFTPSHTGRREGRHSSIFLWHLLLFGVCGLVRLPQTDRVETHRFVMSAEHKRMFCRVAYLPRPFLSTLARSNLIDSEFAARDSEFRSEFEFACSANPSLVSVPIEYLAKLRGQSGSREWLLNEMCFARFNTPAQHSIGCIPTHENHGDGGVIPTHTIS